MNMKVYQLQYYDEEDEIWRVRALDMCHGARLCADCKKNGSSDDCSYFWTCINDFAAVSSAQKDLEREGFQTRIKSWNGEEG